MSESPHAKKVLVKLAKALLILVVITAAASVFAEFGLRLSGYIIARIQTPEIKRTDIAEADYLVACFGDSHTIGFGASSKEFTYPAQLERTLNQRHKDIKFVVLNEGEQRFNSSHVLSQAKNCLSTLPRAPNIIFIIISANNMWNLNPCTALSEGYDSLPAGKRLIGLIEKTRLGKLAVITYFRIMQLSVSRNTKAKRIISPFFLNPMEEKDRAFLETWLKHDVSKIIELTKPYGTKVMLGLYVNKSMVNSIIRDVAASLSIPLCDLPRDMDYWREKNLFSTTHTNYLNDKGYALFAEHIADCMERYGFIPRKR